MLDIKERNGRLWIMGTLEGRRIRETTGFGVGAERAAREKLRQRERELLEGKRRGPLVRDAAREYLARPEGVGKTTAIYVRAFGDSPTGRKYLSEVDLAQVYRHYSQSGKARETIRREIGAVQAFMNWASELHGMQRTFKITKPSKGEERLRFLEPAEVKAMIDAAVDWFKPIVVAFFYTGMRRSELAQLTWSQVKDGHFLVPTKKGKTGKIRWRTIDIHPQVAKVMGNRKGPNSHVFSAPEGGPLNDVTRINKEWDRTAKKAGVKDTVPHDARRTFASMLLDRGVDLRTIADLLGHTKLDLLMLYAQVRGVNRKKSVAMLPVFGEEKETDDA